MSEKQSNFECTVICWGIAAGVGLVAMVMLYMLADFGALQAFFTGGLIGFLLGLVLSLFVCRGQTAAADLNAAEKPAQRYKRHAEENQAGTAGASAAAAPAAGASSAAHAETPAAGHTEEAPSASASEAAGSAAETSGSADTTPAAAASVAAPLMSSSVKPSAPLAGEAELAERKGAWKYDGGNDAPQAAKPAAKKAAAKKSSAKADKSADAAPAKAKRAPVAADGKPELYDAPPADGADDLKLISGVGPKLEQTLNDMGIYRFHQVAAWRKKEIAWVDDRLRFKGRIERDDWMSQAKILAKGGETEFSKRKKK
ncbi:MAG: hypothetical protein AB8B60_18275 [Sulfitobacter sp.]